jgi:hypothetical protein
MDRACFTQTTPKRQRSHERSELNLHEKNQLASCLRPLKNNLVQMKYSIYLLLLIPNALFGQCVSQVHSFKPGEKITYLAYYNWGFVWVYAGDIEFSVKQKSYAGKQAYQFDVTGTSRKSYDWMYKIRDHFQSLVEMETFNPLTSERKTSEGGYDAYESYVFANAKKKIYSAVANSDKPFKRDTINSQPCVFDVLTVIYYCRTVDFDRYKIEDKIPLKIIVDNKIYPTYLRYLGKETLKTHDGKKYKCIKFTALLVEGTIFKGGEDMTIWVTDDDNRVPVLVEAKILIGSVKAYLGTTDGLNNEFKAQIK